MRNALIALSLITSGSLFATACGTPDYQYAGFRTYDHFPLDGAEREWLYKHQDKDFLMLVEKLPNPEAIGSKRIHTLRYAQQDPYRLMYSIKWSSDSTDGVEIHGYMVEENTGGDGSGGDNSGDNTGEGSADTGAATVDVVTGQWVEFSPPLQLTEFQMAPGESVVSSGGGVDYTTTFETMENCPNDWRSDWECMKIVVESSEAEPAPFVGTWHWATRFGTSLFQPQGDNFPWTLVTAEYVQD